jgi:branched-chain amino acid transport system substrate-binding protein
MTRAGSTQPAKYLPVLHKIQYKGVTGPIAFDARGDIRDGTITLYSFKGGKRSVLTVTK